MPKLFTLQGRLSRLGYFKWFIVLTLAMIVAMLVVFGGLFLASSPDNMMNNTGIFSIVSGLIFIIAFFFGIIANFCIIVRRLHDCGLHGLFSLLLFTGVGQLLSIVLLFIPGTKGDNQYGPAPESGY